MLGSGLLSWSLEDRKKDRQPGRGTPHSMSEKNNPEFETHDFGNLLRAGPGEVGAELAGISPRARGAPRCVSVLVGREACGVGRRARAARRQF